MKTKIFLKQKQLIPIVAGIIAVAGLLLASCNNHSSVGQGAISAQDAAQRVYVAPGQYDEFYAFMSGGYNGQVSVYGLPSGRLFKIIPVFSQNPENGYGYSEETKPLLMTSYGFIPWDDAHHPELSQTNGVPDGRWLFINANNTPRVARIDLKTFETVETIEIPNSAGNHSSPFVTENTEYVVAGTRFGVPIPQKDVPIASYKQNFGGVLSFIKVAPSGDMDLAFQLMMPGFDYDLAHAGKGKSKDWVFFTCYNSEEAHTLLEVNASQKDKDFVAAINWKKAEEYVQQGKYHEFPGTYYDNRFDTSTQTAHSYVHQGVKVLIPSECPGLVYFIPAPKSPHGVDVDPSGNYIVANGKLSADLSVFSFDKIQQAIQQKQFDGEVNGIPVLKFDAVLAGVVKSGGLGPLHTEFDDKGNAYTTFFISSEVVKWKLGTWQVEDRQPTFYSPGHLMIPGGDSRKPWGKYLVALNKITKDRYLPTGPELSQSAQLFDISGDKMKLLLDFPTVGEPHYAQAIPASILMPRSDKIYQLASNHHPYLTRTEKDAKVVRKGNRVDVYMTEIRSHFVPDNIEGIYLGDTVYFHVTNLEQDWDAAHGFAVEGNRDNAELLLMPGQTKTLKWVPERVGVFPFYCTDFCSALHQEMQGYVRVSSPNDHVALTWSTGKE
ncbi:Sec-dependent nitrous-oxide reductase [Thermoflavifilum thermophilum]|uniref:Nitrous-oxide reductase n=1 Tax=Thermoflavifilum thermophilum TaxID=1393122 RepID=A0A1I7N3C7_9BACT|nr:Sec-dependent nitrous-oxide reductase [Thermoflavifilum thermophilum]SFV29182.1 nitrous-oxide reductase [Thermoflavifilum thermophilum]